MENKICIITGGTNGIGLVAARKLIQRDCYVIIAARDKTKGLSVVESLKKETGKSTVEFMECDLSSFASIRSFVDEFHKKNLPLHILINNAGVSMGREVSITQEGFETTIAVNHLGHFLLANLLLDDLKKSAPSRIVVLTSKTHIPGYGGGKPPNFKWTIEEMNDPKNYDPMVVYKNSKLANMWFTYELSRRLEGTNVYVNAVCPGLIPTTGLFRNAGWFIQVFMKWFMYYMPFSRTEDHGGDCIVHAALDIEDGITGKMFSDKKEMASSEESYDTEKAKKIWQLSEEWTKLSS